MIKQSTHLTGVETLPDIGRLAWCSGIRRLAVTLLSLLPLLSWGQTPLWTKDGYRDTNYPADTWYTGYVYTLLGRGVDVGAALKALERDAQRQMAESIALRVESETTYKNSSATYGGNEALSDEFRQAVRTSASAVMVKSEVKSYYDTATGMAHAFAAVRRPDLANYYKNLIDLQLSRVDATLELAGRLVESGKKMSASRQCETAKKMLDSLAHYQNLLIAINPNAVNADLQGERADSLKIKVNQRLIELEQSTLVYINCKYELKGGKDDAFSADPGIMCNIIRQALSENGCSIIDNPAEADYELTILASTTQRSDGSGSYGILSYYANVKGTLYNRLTRKKTVDFTFFNDPAAYATGKTPADAATKAFRQPALKNKILEKFLTAIGR